MPQSSPKPSAVAFIASESEEAELSRLRLVGLYGEVEPSSADVIVALGGDGFMLQTLHAFMDTGKPIYGMNRGTVGFLMNEYRDGGLMERVATAKVSRIHPLAMEARDVDGTIHRAYAINEVSLLRQSYQAARLRVSIDGKVRLEELICDGILVATPAGSTAYNLSAHGPIIPINAPLLALTPISAFRPRLWRGALVPQHAEISFDVIDPDKRPVNAVADHTEFKSVTEVTIKQDAQAVSLIMFDPDHSWDDQILAEQFKY